MKRVMVIGCPGSGKSTFARKLRDKTGLPLYYLDMIWHRSDKTHISREEFNKKLGEILEKNEWIIDGNYNNTLETRMKKCDTVFFLDMPLQVCLESVALRIGKKREDMPWSEEKFDPEFKEWIEGFTSHGLVKINELLKIYKDKNIVIFRSREEVNGYLEKL